ncbi:pentatricopeptide repeat-containing protein At5g39350-like [Typha latifolia]|uniref:pentatricopeptide repeat-containing protein At5g39350-like n=1 Tax=Typha latifolia TaxID=4733 RepID=UPI003C2D8F62
MRLTFYRSLCTSVASFSQKPFTLHSRLRELSHAGDHLGLLSLYAHVSRTQAVRPDRPTYLFLLKASAFLHSRHLGLSFFAQIVKSGLQNDILVSTTLVDTLSKCWDSDVSGAREVFDQMPGRDVGAWNAMLSGYMRKGCVHEALSLFLQMGICGENPNSQTLSVLLQVCASSDDRRLGRSIHGYSVRHREIEDNFLVNSLLVYYNRIGDVHVSERIFERMVEKDAVSWNGMISGYARNGLCWRALEAFRFLKEEGLCMDLVALETALQACAYIGEDAIEDGRSIHVLMVKLGYLMDVYTMNSLLFMYCKCGMVDAVQSLFDRMEVRNIVSWSIIIDGYVRMKCPDKALELIRCMRFVESDMSSELFVSSLQSVRLLGGCVKHVMCFHCLVIVMGFDSDLFVSSSLIAAYGDCGEIGFGHRILGYVVSKISTAIVCCNTMLTVYAHHGYFSEALELLRSMQVGGCILDAVSLVNGLSICSQSRDLRLGKGIHGYMFRNKFDCDVFVSTSLLEFYVRCERLNIACHLFLMMQQRNIVTWNTMINGCLQNGFPRTSLKLFHLMQQQDGLMPDSTSIVGVIEAIALRGCAREREFIHKYVLEAGLINDEFIANSIIAMHGRFHEFDYARSVLDKARKNSTVMWNNMIAVYSHHGLISEAVSIFHRMKLNNVALDSVTFLCLLRACAVVSTLSCLTRVHTVVCKAGFESDVHIGSSLIDLYAKCGDLRMARLFFDRMNSKSVISWNSMIQGYGLHGITEEASNLFCEMQQSGLTPTMTTFLILISACSHAGDIKKGQHYIHLMTSARLVSPRIEHISSIIDLLGRNGLVEKAHETLEKMPTDPGVDVWGALLGACRVQGNLDIGLAAAKNLFELDPLNCGYHVLLSNMCAEAGRWAHAYLIRSKVDNMRLKKVHGVSIVDSFS